MIYVDNAYIPARVNYIKAKWCHLFTDQDDQQELHDFAKRIGLQRSWFQHPEAEQDAPWLCHYDVTMSKRRLAVAAGAIEIGWHELGRIMLARREAWAQAASTG